MLRRFASLLIVVMFAAQAGAQVSEQTADAVSPAGKEARLESGVRLRLFCLAGTLHRLGQLAPDQSPNLDLTTGGLQITGSETYLTDHAPPYIAKLTALLQVDSEGEYHFRLSTQGLASLRVADKEVISANRSKEGIVEAIALTKGSHPIEVTLIANDATPQLEVRWKVPGELEFRKIPTSALAAESFVFRPTNGGVKRLVTESDRPGLRRKVDGLYPGLDIATMHPPDVEVPVGGLATLSDGTLVVATFDARRLKAPRPQPEPDGELWLYHNAAGNPAEIRRELIASNLYEPSGVCAVDDAIFVSQRLEITRFDKQETTNKWIPTTIATGWESNDFHALSFGLVHEPGSDNHPGFLYMAKGTGLGLGRNPPRHGAVWRVDLSLPAGQNVEAITGGHRTPNGLGWGPEGTLLVADNQGEFTPANELNVVRDGAFYGFFQRVGDESEASPFQPEPTRRENSQAVTEAAIWLPQDEIGNSPAQPVLIPERWPFAGQMLVCDMKYGGLNRVALEQVGGEWQGVALRFTQGCEGGINRAVFGPDQSLYVGAIGGDHASTWNWVDPLGRKTYQGLQRLRPNGHVTFDIENVHALPGGFEVRFTKPVDLAWLRNVDHYQLEQWTYQATAEYGGPKKEVETLAAQTATPASDGKSVVLEIGGLKPSRVVHFLMDPVSTDGQEIWSAEAWYTLKRLPQAPRQRADTGVPRHVVFVSGDDEYDSETSLPMLASMLERRSGYRVTVLKSVDDQGKFDRHGHSIPGLRALREADLAVFFMRFRALPDAQLREIENYVASGRPVIGLRTSTHAFRYEQGPHTALNDEFGKQVFGQKWIAHYGHGTTSTVDVLDSARSHPILRGVPDEFDLRSWLYIMNRGDDQLPEDCIPLLTGNALRSEAGTQQAFGEPQPVAWTRELATQDNPSKRGTQRIFYTSLGHPRDFLEAPSRRLLLNAIYWALGQEAQIPPTGIDVPLPKGYEPADPR